jgi:lysophospholipase L1-like esterase
VLALLAGLLVVAVLGTVLAGALVLRRLPAAGGSSPRPTPAANQQAPSRTEARALRVAFVGASVTRGWYVTSLEDAYPAVTARLLARSRDRAVDWSVVARPGAPAAAVLTWELPRDQDIVVLHVVSNDFLYGTPLAEYQTRYRALLHELLAVSPRAQLVCLGDWGKVGAVNRLGASAYTYDTTVSQECSGVGGTYVPLNQDYDVAGARGPRGHPSMFGPARGDFHPNDEGDRLIAASVMQGVNGSPPIEQAPTQQSTAAPQHTAEPRAPAGSPTRTGGLEPRSR